MRIRVGCHNSHILLQVLDIINHKHNGGLVPSLPLCAVFWVCFLPQTQAFYFKFCPTASKKETNKQENDFIKSCKTEWSTWVLQFVVCMRSIATQ